MCCLVTFNIHIYVFSFFFGNALPLTMNFLFFFDRFRFLFSFQVWNLILAVFVCKLFRLFSNENTFAIYIENYENLFEELKHIVESFYGIFNSLRQGENVRSTRKMLLWEMKIFCVAFVQREKINLLIFYANILITFPSFSLPLSRSFC